MYSLLWVFGCLTLVILGYYLGATHALHPDSVGSPVDFLIPQTETINTDLVFVIEILGAILAVFLLEVSKNKLLSMRWEFKNWKHDIDKLKIFDN
jgi:hypothetical protein